MSFVNIATKLKTILDTIKADSNKHLSAVFNYDPGYTDSLWFPYACVISREAEESSLDTVYNQALYRFIIRACDVNKDKAQLETTIRSLADEILAELRKRANLTFDGTVDRVLPFTVTFGWDNSQQVPLRYVEIGVDVLMNYTTL